MIGIGIWFVVLIGIVVTTDDPVKSAIALGASGAGIVWCFTAAGHTNRELTFVELLIEAAKDDHAVLGEIVDVYRKRLELPAASPSSPRTKKPNRQPA